jgi:hypothetical protein
MWRSSRSRDQSRYVANSLANSGNYRIVWSIVALATGWVCVWIRQARVNTDFTDQPHRFKGKKSYQYLNNPFNLCG